MVGFAIALPTLRSLPYGSYNLIHRRVDRSGLVISFWFPRTNVNAIELRADTIELRADTIKLRADTIKLRADTIKLRADTIKLRADTQVCPYKTPCI